MESAGLCRLDFNTVRTATRPQIAAMRGPNQKTFAMLPASRKANPIPVAIQDDVANAADRRRSSPVYALDAIAGVARAAALNMD